MFKTLTSLLPRRRTLNTELELDHVELAQDHLILGLTLTWANDTSEPMEIGEVMVNLFHKGKIEAPVSLSYLGRFVRIPFQKTVTKIAGATSFPLRAGSTLVENIRFFTRNMPDLADGTYAVELHTMVAEGTYVHNFELKVVPELRHRVSGADTETGTLILPSSSFTRALRIGLSPDAGK